jgi:serine phosphatase RsbU (regulator of sigma subunit)
LGDCTGHGVPGAFMTLIANGALEQALKEMIPGDPAALIQRLHQIIQSQLNQDVEIGTSDDGLELGVCLLANNQKKLTFSGARFSLFHMGAAETVEEIKGDKKGIGYRGIPQDAEFTNVDVPVSEGKRFFMTSDGLIDQVGGEKHRGFGKVRLKKLLVELKDKPIADFGQPIFQALERHQGGESRRDDVSFLGFQIHCH